MPASALMLSLADTSPFAPPPNRPSRPKRETVGGMSATRVSLVAAFIRRVDAAMRAQGGPWIPRVSEHYPY